MRILQVMAGAEFGGAETAFVDMCLAMHDAQECIQVVTRDNKLRVPQLEQAGIHVDKLPFGGMFDFYTSFRLKKIISDFRPHIIQTWMSRASQKTPSWRNSLDVPPYLVVSRLGGYYKVKYFSNTDYFTTITPDIKKHLIDKGIAGDKIQHINNFAETELVTRPVKRSEMNTPENVPLLLALGRLHEAKAFDILLESIKALEEVYLWIAGEGPLRQELEQYCQDNGLENRVRFLGWRDDRAALLQEADICVFSSRYEPFGTVFVQAWAQKTPLVTTNADGPRQFVRDRLDGLVVPIDNSDALSRAIKFMLNNPRLRDDMVQAGYNRYLAEFTKENTVNSYLSFYKDILQRENINNPF